MRMSILSTSLVRLSEVFFFRRFCFIFFFLINFLTFAGKTALHTAVEVGAEAFLKTLLGKGANLDIQDGQGSTPLHTAVKGDNCTCPRFFFW